jgi:hypothetical protein
VWLQDAAWGGQKPWRVEITDLSECGSSGDPCYDDAHTRAAAAFNSPNLSDGSNFGDWRLPTYSELDGVRSGTDPVSYSNMRAFTGIQDADYWTSTSHSLVSNHALYLDFTGGTGSGDKSNSLYVWPVRGP